jgi:hypothetical protein
MAHEKLSCAAMRAQIDGSWYHADVDMDGLQLWQPLLGLSPPAA